MYWQLNCNGVLGVWDGIFGIRDGVSGIWDGVFCNWDAWQTCHLDFGMYITRSMWNNWHQLEKSYRSWQSQQLSALADDWKCWQLWTMGGCNCHVLSFSWECKEKDWYIDENAFSCSNQKDTNKDCREILTLDDTNHKEES